MSLYSAHLTPRWRNGFDVVPSEREYMSLGRENVVRVITVERILLIEEQKQVLRTSMSSR